MVLRVSLTGIARGWRIYFQQIICLGHSLGYGCMYECAYDVCICERCVHSKVDLNGCSQTDRQTDR